MTETTTKNYQATFILDLRESEDDVQKVLADISGILASIGGTVTGSEDLGMRDFSRAADHRFSRGHYVRVDFDGDPSTPAELNEKLRLDKRVNRIFLESV